MTEDYEELFERLEQVERENEQLKADLKDARQALTGIKYAFTQKLNVARLNSCRENCPMLDESEVDDDD